VPSALGTGNGSQMAQQSIEIAQNELGMCEAGTHAPRKRRNEKGLSHWKQTTCENGETKTELSH
jgi:hypothetical protein